VHRVSGAAHERLFPTAGAADLYADHAGQGRVQALEHPVGDGFQRRVLQPFHLVEQAVVQLVADFRQLRVNLQKSRTMPLSAARAPERVTVPAKEWPCRRENG